MSYCFVEKLDTSNDVCGCTYIIRSNGRMVVVFVLLRTTSYNFEKKVDSNSYKKGQVMAKLDEINLKRRTSFDHSDRAHLQTYTKPSDWSLSTIYF